MKHLSWYSMDLQSKTHQQNHVDPDFWEGTPNKPQQTATNRNRGEKFPFNNTGVLSRFQRRVSSSVGFFSGRFWIFWIPCISRSLPALLVCASGGIHVRKPGEILTKKNVWLDSYQEFDSLHNKMWFRISVYIMYHNLSYYIISYDIIRNQKRSILSSFREKWLVLHFYPPTPKLWGEAAVSVENLFVFECRWEPGGVVLIIIGIFI